jgi:hypothetical protein
MAKSPVAILYDSAGNPVEVLNDGGVYRLRTDTKLTTGHGLATETKQDSLLTELQLKADLTETQPVSAASLPLPTGAATEATLATIDADTSVLAAVDFATQTTLATRASETTAAEINARLGDETTPAAGTVNKQLETLNAKDFSTETTLAALKTNFDAEDFATQTTLAELNTRVGDEVTPATGTVNKHLTDLVAKDFATETTLATRSTSANQTNGSQKTQIVDADNSPVTVPVDGDAAVGTDRGFPIMGKTVADVFRWLQVEDTGKLSVASTPPQPPAGTTPFGLAVNEGELEVGAGGDVASPHDTDSPLIASGDTLFLQFVLVGTQGDPAESGSKVEVYWVEGAGATEHLVERFYIDGATESYPLPDLQESRDGTAMLGNGTNTFLRVRRIRFSNTAQEVDFDVRGYTSS